MPSWKKIITSGSDATLNSLYAPSITGSLLGTASYATQALSASYAPSTPAFPYTGSAEITGSLGVTGSFSVLDSIDGTNKILIGSGPIPGSTEDSVNWDSRTLFDSNGNFSVRWDVLRSMYDANASQSVDWNNRLLKFDNGPGDFTVNWNAGLLRDTGSSLSVNWQDRIAIDTSAKTSIDWQNRWTVDSTGIRTSIDWGTRQLKNSSEYPVLNWQSGVIIESGSFIVRGDLIPGSPPFIPDMGPYDAIKVDDINYERKLYGSPFQGASASIDFGNRGLLDITGVTALDWNGFSGTYETFLYNQQYVGEATRVNLFANNNNAGQILGESYFDANVVDNDLVYLNTDGQWYQVDQTTDSSTKMLGIAKNIFSQTGSVIIEGDVVVSVGSPYPIVDNADYGLPIYIKSGSGTTMDTTVPASGYVRIVGHCYWNNGGGGGDEWIMKFRPSNEWIEL